MAKTAPMRVASAVLNLVQFALALLVIVLVSWKMMRVNVDNLQVNSRCLIDGSGKSGSLRGVRFCAYLIGVGVVSIVASAVLGCATKCLSCLTANVCGISGFVSIIIDAALGLWWAVAFALTVTRGVAANKAGYPEVDARNGIIAATFFASLSFFLDILLTLRGLTASK